MLNKRSISLSIGYTFCLAASLTLLASASYDPYDTKEGSLTGKVTFTRDIAPIFFKNCAECHRPGEGAPFSALSFKDVRPWAKSIREKVLSRQMPPWHADPHYGDFKNNRALTQQEIETVVRWVDDGAFRFPKSTPTSQAPINTNILTSRQTLPRIDILLRSKRVPATGRSSITSSLSSSRPARRIWPR
jgi:hypothetical protein